MTDNEKKIAEILEDYRKNRELLEQGYANAISDFKNDPRAIEENYEARKNRLIQKASEAISKIDCCASKVRDGLEEVRMAFYVAHADGRPISNEEIVEIGKKYGFESAYFSITEYGQLLVIDTKTKKFAMHTDNDIRIFIRGEVQPKE